MVDSASEKSNVDKSKTSAVVNETTPKDKQVDVKPVSAPPKPVITSLKPIRPVAKSLAAPPPFSVQKPPAPPHTSPQIVRSTGTTAQKPPTTDPNNEPGSKSITFLFPANFKEPILIFIHSTCILSFLLRISVVLRSLRPKFVDP